MGHILGNAVASVDREAGPDTRVCLERLAKESQRLDALVSALQRRVDGASQGPATGGTVTNTGGDLDLDLVVLGAGGVDVKTLATDLTGKFLRDDSSWVAIPGGGDALTSSPLSQFAATTSAQLAGVISDEVGTDKLVFNTSPTLVTPTLGVAAATSVNKVAITAPATGSTLTIQDGFTLTANGNAAVSGTNTGDQTLPIKATGSEINTGTDDAKFATPLAIADSNIAFLSDIPALPVKCTGTEINTGTDDAKFATAKAITDSNVAFTSDIPSMATIAAAMYPVGSIYVAVVSTDPATLFGMGTWAAFGAGRVLVGLDSGDTDFDTAEETSGAKTVASSAQTFAGTPSSVVVNHTHTVTINAGTTDGTWASFDSSTGSGSGHNYTTSNPDSGGAASYTPAGTNTPGAATSVVQPSIAVYMWKRTA